MKFGCSSGSHNIMNHTVSFICPSALIYTPPLPKYPSSVCSRDPLRILPSCKSFKHSLKMRVQIQPQQRKLPRLSPVKVQLLPLVQKRRWERRVQSDVDISPIQPRGRLPPLDFEGTHAELASPLRPWSAAQSKRTQCLVA